ncbi:hypothetical protein G5S35_22270 [Paraburkholderia tropica]|uniref:hypothetical protein n=1 Tax=Paraburkholderia tropica TaxID=92647 RepID=UPI0016039306|nr:hypothetical protein [Paraburkholderia tropica]QNB14266.1 hypothetical protein G5S35_22270 [Paraburkholderia tropica]
MNHYPHQCACDCLALPDTAQTLTYQYKINLPQGTYFANEYQIVGSLIQFKPVAKESYLKDPDPVACSERLILASHFTIFEL